MPLENKDKNPTDYFHELNSIYAELRTLAEADIQEQGSLAVAITALFLHLKTAADEVAVLHGIEPTEDSYVDREELAANWQVMAELVSNSYLRDSYPSLWNHLVYLFQKLSVQEQRDFPTKDPSEDFYEFAEIVRNLYQMLHQEESLEEREELFYLHLGLLVYLEDLAQQQVLHELGGFDTEHTDETIAVALHQITNSLPEIYS